MPISYKNCSEDEYGSKLEKSFPLRNSLVQINPGRVYLPRKYIELSEKIFNAPIREDDVWVISYPRTGSTWAQEMVWLLGNNLDYESAGKIVNQLRAPMIEVTALFSDDDSGWVQKVFGESSVDYIKNLPSPRFLRSHLQWNLLPTGISTVKPKIIYTARNPKDLCVSFYHYCQLIHHMSISFEVFCELFLNGAVPIGQYFDHVLPFWNRRHDPNILFLKYEDMKRDLPATIKKCADFLEIRRELIDSDLNGILQHLGFETMQSNPAINLDFLKKPDESQEQREIKNQFIRKGEIGDWQNHMSQEISQRFDKWTEFHTRGTGLEFDYM